MEIRTQDGQVMFESEFRSYIKANGGPSWDQTTPEILAELGAEIVLEGPQAQTNAPYEFSYRNGVEQIDGKWYTKYSVGPVFQDLPANDKEPAKTAAEQMVEYKAQKDANQAKSVREDRSRRLAECDWTQGKDIADAVSQLWAAYRQALRNVPTQAGFPWDVQWPNKPE